MTRDSPDDNEVVQTAVEAAEDVILSRYSRSDLRDIDIGVSFEDGRLSIDIYLNAPGDAERVAEDAALAARAAVDDLFDV
ncbi:MAG: hypothetical protein J07HX64_00554 [halophilic archaeon J07HX64]|nr:MAG: hypothetical protein J07HX64_00554 [halophilic archaeon J07HX64]